MWVVFSWGHALTLIRVLLTTTYKMIPILQFQGRIPLEIILCRCFRLASVLIKNPKEWRFEATLSNRDYAGDELHYLHGENIAVTYEHLKVSLQPLPWQYDLLVDALGKSRPFLHRFPPLQITIFRTFMALTKMEKEQFVSTHVFHVLKLVFSNK